VRRLLPLLLFFLATLPVLPAVAEETAPTRYGVATLNGAAYDPDHIGLSLVQGFALLDYDRVFWHRAPEALRLKLEANLGVTTDGRARTLGSLNMLALYYLEGLGGRGWRPYGEAGIGVIYTDFHVEGQGLHLNFNPQLGAGFELDMGSGALLAGVRLHHLSNGGLHHDNRGMNSALLLLGWLF